VCMYCQSAVVPENLIPAQMGVSSGDLAYARAVDSGKCLRCCPQGHSGLSCVSSRQYLHLLPRIQARTCWAYILSVLSRVAE
jgi:hypothetical protein